MGQPLLIVGASGRAAAASALRAGFEPFVIDLFADADTKRLCPVLKCDPNDYPHGFVPLAVDAPPAPWMYTGGLENYPDVVAAISERRPLWGNGPDVLAKVRDPWFLDSLPRHVTGFASVLPRDSPQPFSLWPFLRKPLRGAGGGGVRFTTAADRIDDPDAFYQEFIEGEVESAVFAVHDGHPIPFGRTKQLIGPGWLHAEGFHYCGNFSRAMDGDPSWGFVHDLCHRVELRGVFGMDFVRHWVVEVNPRYTASMEVLEFASGVHLLGRVTPMPPPRRVVGKGIYYAAEPIIFPASGPWDDSLTHCTDVWRRPDYADIPEPGTVVESGQPMLTVFAEAATEGECVQHLKRCAAELDRLFDIPTPPEGSQ